MSKAHPPAGAGFKQQGVREGAAIVAAQLEEGPAAATVKKVPAAAADGDGVAKPCPRATHQGTLVSLPAAVMSVSATSQQVHYYSMWTGQRTLTSRRIHPRLHVIVNSQASTPLPHVNAVNSRHADMSRRQSHVER